ncbi:MAG TPA: hypothetical protein VNU71_13410 [Burkholderiaceae bacterium]|nr:hypothetical protein [Burkholderiaceae bacterium]
MSDTALVRFAGTRELAHVHAVAGYVHAQTLIGIGKRVKFTVEEAEDELTIKQRGFLHAAVLPQIAEQVVMPDGTRYVPKVWKEHLKDLFIADKWDMVRLPFVRDRKTGAWKPSSKKVPVKRRKSTEALSIKGYSDFIDKCIAHAAVEWGVRFHFIAEEREAVRYVAPKRKAKQPEEVTA